MRLTIPLALALTLALALSASANMLTSAVWTGGTTESFTDYDPPFPGGPDPENISYIEKILGMGQAGHAQRNCSYNPWYAWQLPQFRGEKLAGDNAVRLNGCSTTFSLRCSWRGMDGTSDSDWFNRVSFRIRSTATTAADYTINIIASSEGSLYEGSNAVPLWDVSNLTLRPHVRRGWDFGPGPEWIGPDISYADGLWHWLDVCYDLTTGDAEWYMDGMLRATLPADPLLQGYFLGRSANNIELWQKAGGAQSGGAIWVDDFRHYSGVPEPSSLLAFATFGIGAFGLMRRRKA